MIGRLTGIIDSHTKNPLLIDVHGVGYLVHVPDRFLASIKIGKVHTLLIYSHIREDAFDLYGFATAGELGLFEVLLTVSGIGPKTALAVVDRGVEAVEAATRRGDVDFFTAVPRLGRKNAQKLIIELKTKLGSLEELDLSGTVDGPSGEVLTVLKSFGFTTKEAQEALRAVGKDPALAGQAPLSTEKKIMLALKYFGK